MNNKLKKLLLPTNIVVGKKERKMVTALNHELYLKAEDILESNTLHDHMGKYGIGIFIDWLENNYQIIKYE